jgi:putative hemolysin
VPKRLALNGAETVASRVAGPMRLLSTLAAPAVWFLSASTDAVLRLLRVRSSDDPPVSEGRSRSSSKRGRVRGSSRTKRGTSPGGRSGSTTVRCALMTPRPGMIWLDADDPPEEHPRLVAESRHSYYPVARGDLDDLLGIAPIKDALAREIRTGEPADLLGSLRPPPLLPEGAPATEAVAVFKGSGLPLALVVDERGNVEGLVTPSDVLEALVGDLEETGRAQVVRRGDGSWLMDGLLDAEEFKERIGLRRLPGESEGDYQTVGGMVMAHLGRVPTAGHRFEWEGFWFEALDMDGNRVDKVLVARTPGPAPCGEAPQG